jgi:Rrf2 family protein
VSPARAQRGQEWHFLADCLVVRMTAKAEYATRAMVQLATVQDGGLVKAEALAATQGIPPNFIGDILSDLRAARLVRSQRGADGGYALARPAESISIADVLRCIDGPLASVHDVGLGDLAYTGATAPLTDVWMALRASMRHVLEKTSLADVVSAALPEHVRALAADYRQQERERRGSR